MSKMMEDTLRIERKVIKHNDFHFKIGQRSKRDSDIPVEMGGFSIETRIYFQEWVGWSDSPTEPNRFVKILEGPHMFVDYIAPYKGKVDVTAEEFVKSFERGLSPACNKYNYSPTEGKDFQRIITKHCIDKYPENN